MSVKHIKRTVSAQGETCPKCCCYFETAPQFESALPYCAECGKVVLDVSHSYCGWCGEPLTEPNALTIDELIEIAESEVVTPIWVRGSEGYYPSKKGEWLLLSGREWEQGYHADDFFTFTNGSNLDFGDYNKCWLAYTHKPKE